MSTRNYTRGSATIRICDYAKGKYQYALLRYYRNGVLETENVRPAEANKRAKEIADDLNRGNAAVADITPAERQIFLYCEQALKPLGIPIAAVVDQFVEAMKQLQGNGTVIEACKAYAKRTASVVARKTVKEVHEALLADAASRKLSEYYQRQMHHELKEFVKVFNVPITELTASAIRQWLDGHTHWGAGTFNTRRKHISNLTEFAKRHEWLPSDWNEMAKIPRKEAEGKEVTIYTPGEMTQLLAAMEGPLLAVTAISGFAGLRTSETCRLLWEDVDLSSGYLKVQMRTARKTKVRRVIPIQPNLKAWLETIPAAERTGSVWKESMEQMHAERREASERAQVPLKDNALRHSYASYRLAVVKSAPQVALEDGHSVQVLQQHYLHVVTEQQGLAWFDIKPDGVTPSGALEVLKLAA